MNVSSPYASRPLPRAALWVGAGVLMVPVLGAFLLPSRLGGLSIFLWFLALAPAFVLGYYRGWNGVAAILVAGVALISLTEVVAAATRQTPPDWQLLTGVVGAFVTLGLGIGWLSDSLLRDRWIAEQMALTDPLTDMPNRRHANVFLEGEFAAARRGRQVAVVFFDLDHFKAYNDRHGHQAGDDALCTLGHILVAYTRRMNLSARYGGEEFVSILSDCDEAGAVAFAERIRSGLRTADIPGEPLAVSAGIALFDPKMTSPEDLLASADRALYRAKADGRDCVRVNRRGAIGPPRAEAEAERSLARG